MKFSKMEEEARQIVIEAGEEGASIDEIWDALGKARKRHWRMQACELMRQVCLKSNIEAPIIERKTRLGRGAKAIYGIKQMETPQ